MSLFEAPGVKGTIEGASLPCHFVRHGGAYSMLLSHDCLKYSSD